MLILIMIRNKRKLILEIFITHITPSCKNDIKI